MLMLLGIAKAMPAEDKATATRLCMDGFNDLAKEAGTKVTGGQTIQAPWYMMGGVATSCVDESEIIRPVKAVPGDVLVLTKPLGTQLAVNAHTWLFNEEKFKRVEDIISREEAVAAYETAARSMMRLNRTGAQLMHQYGAHAATDVTGFGILGHASNLASNQLAEVDFEIHTLPVIKKMWAVNERVSFRLSTGYSAETSGGLLVALPKEKAHAFITEISETDGWPAWIVGSVVKGKNTARIVENPSIVELDYRPFDA
ncbi:Selenide, water dikinase 1, partial [Quaeritorhiza haematococci]